MAEWWEDAPVVDAAPAKSGSPLDRALKEEGVTGKLADVARSIYHQETKAGRDTATSDAGAVGGMQIKPDTFKRFADKGWSIEDPDQNARAAVRYIKSLNDKTGGDPRLISVGYYGGEGAIPKAKAGIAVRDPRNPNAPDTLQYADQVTSRVPKSASTDAPKKSDDWWSAAPVVEGRTGTADNPFGDSASTPDQQPRGTGQELLRQIGLTARAGSPYAAGAALGAAAGAPFGGIGAIPGAAAGVGAVALSDLAANVYNPIANVAGLPHLPGPSEAVNKLADYIGLPKPENERERVVQNLTSAMAGAGGNAAAARIGADRLAATPTVRNALSQLGERPGLQVASAATSEAAREGAAQAGAGPVGQTLASLAGGLAPTAAIAGGAAATRNALRGSDRNIPEMQGRMKTFEEAGSTRPSVGQVTGNRNAQAVESLLSKTPGGAGQMSKRAEQQAEEIGNKATEIADNLSPNATPSVAGRAIEKGLSGPGGFVDRFKAGQKALYDKLDPYFRYSDGSSKSVKLPATMKALDMLNPSIPGAPSTSKFFQNAEMQRIKDAVFEDVGSVEAFGQRPNIKASNEMVKKAFRPSDLQDLFKQYGGDNLPYEAVKKMRTLVGEKLDDFSLASSVPRSKWKALYGALSQDLDDAARATGKPDAVKAMTRANTFTRAGYGRIEDVLDKVGKGVPEKIFKSAVNPSDMQAGATKIGSIMKSLTPAERDVVKSAFIRRMGQAAAGQQGAEGDRFSTQTFLTNWNKMSPQAKAVMFSGQDGKLRVGLEQIAKAADSIKTGSKVFSNPSGTSHATAQIGLAGGIAGAIASGNVGVAAGLLGGAAGANLTARLMTNQDFVQWLAKSTRLSSAAVPAAVNSLQRSVQSAPDGVRADADKYIDSLK